MTWGLVLVRLRRSPSRLPVLHSEKTPSIPVDDAEDD
jgi:hypothetical protein